MLAIASTSERVRSRREDDETAIRMAELFIKNERRGYPTTLEDLDAEGFTTTDIQLHTPAARRIARQTMADRDVADDAVEYDRTARIDEAARLMAGLITAGEGVIFAKLREGGFATRELGQLYPEIISRTCQLLVADEPAPAEVN